MEIKTLLPASIKFDGAIPPFEKMMRIIYLNHASRDVHYSCILWMRSIYICVLQSMKQCICRECASAVSITVIHMFFGEAMMDLLFYICTLAEHIM